MDCCYFPAINGFFAEKFGHCFPQALVCYHYAKDIPNLRDYLKGEIEIDSGGFQLVSGKVDIHPLSPLRYAESVNANIVFALDRPPYENWGNKFPPELFNRAMEFTARNGEAMIENREVPSVKIFGVVQGQTLDEIDRWYKLVSKNHKFDGYSLSPKPSSDKNMIANYLSYAIRNIDAPVHILQIGGMGVLPLICYAQTKFKHRITFDSSSYSQGAQNRQYFSNYSYSLDPMQIKGDSQIDMKKLCDCQFCQRNTDLTINDSNLLLGMHNWLNYKNRVSFFQEIIAKKQYEVLPAETLEWFDKLDKMVAGNV